jgi:copper chaperone
MTAIVTQEFVVEGMHCQGCVRSVTGAVSQVPGVTRVDVSLDKKAATVQFDSTAVKPATIVAAIEGAGFEARAA